MSENILSTGVRAKAIKPPNAMARAETEMIECLTNQTEEMEPEEEPDLPTRDLPVETARKMLRRETLRNPQPNHSMTVLRTKLIEETLQKLGVDSSEW
jgi:hypothetical protein